MQIIHKYNSVLNFEFICFPYKWEAILRYITYAKEKKKYAVWCTIMTLIYSSEVSTNPPNYKFPKFIKVFKKKNKCYMYNTSWVFFMSTIPWSLRHYRDSIFLFWVSSEHRQPNQAPLLALPLNMFMKVIRTYTTGAACQQRTLTPPDTWSWPTLGLACILMSRPFSP